MGKKEVVWRKEAIAFVSQYLQWYEANRSKDAATAFFDSVADNIERLRVSPGIGRREPAYPVAGKTTRSITIYKYYRILYAYDDRELIIIALWDMRSIIR